MGTLPRRFTCLSHFLSLLQVVLIFSPILQSNTLKIQSVNGGVRILTHDFPTILLPPRSSSFSKLGREKVIRAGIGLGSEVFIMSRKVSAELVEENTMFGEGICGQETSSPPREEDRLTCEVTFVSKFLL